MPGAARRMVDPRQPRFGQFLTGLLSSIAFVFRIPALFIALAVILGAGTLSPRMNLWAYAYRGFKRVARLGPPGELEDAAPPRFATTLGFVFFTLASVLYFLVDTHGASMFAYGVDLLVAALAFLGAAGLCVGCEIYLWFRRVQGRRQAPVGA